MFYYCTCHKERKRQKDVDAGRTPFREVKAEEGVCNDCGYYAVAYFDRIDPDGGKLYNKIMNEVIEVPENKVNTRLVKTTKYRKRGFSDQSGEIKDGDLDV